MKKTNLLLGITMGDAAGIGPEIILKAIYKRKWETNIKFVIIGSYKVFKEISLAMSLPLPSLLKRNGAPFLNFNELPQAGIWEALDDDNAEVSRVVANLKWKPGRKDYSSALCAAHCIKAAVRYALLGNFDAIITAPINKESFAMAKIPYPGHTEYIASLCGRDKFGMMLIGGGLKVMLVTRHIPLKYVSKAISKDEVITAVELTHKALKWFGIKKPIVGVCGLNPHCGDGGVLGDEEDRIIRPAIEALRRKRIQVEGPIAGDVAFYYALQNKYQAVVAMYHDQGLAPLKTIAFDEGVNLTLGLPIIRTSPDHGTAFDIAGKNKADPSSMIKAIEVAIELAKHPNPFK